MIRIMHIACREGCGFNKTIFVHIDVSLKTIGRFTLAVRALFDVVIGFRVLSAVAVLVFIRAIALGLKDTGIHHTDFSRANIQTL